jgi:hypothetical protein
MPITGKRTAVSPELRQVAARALILAIGASLSLPPGLARAAVAPEEVQRIIIVGTRIRPTSTFYWGPFQMAVRLPYSLGPWRNEDEWLDARSNCVELGWKWPKTKDAISAALHDVRCNPVTASSQAANLTSRDLSELRLVAAVAIYHEVRAVENNAGGRFFQVMWADGGSSRYAVTGAVGSAALGTGEISNTVGSGVPEPSPNCVKG